MSENLTITISGPAKSGKSILATMIAEWLVNSGVDAPIFFDERPSFVPFSAFKTAVRGSIIIRTEEQK